MGCFSVSCNLSGLPIYSQEIGIIIIKQKNKKNGEITVEKNFICSNDGAKVYFEPVSPIIWGQCDTYGNIENIEINDSFKWTCKNVLKIKATKKNFHEWVSSNWMEVPEDNLYVTFFLKSIVTQVIEYQRKESSLFNHYCQHWVLEKFSHIFTFLGEDKSIKRYNKVYQLADGRKIYSDGNWIYIKDNHPFYKTSSLLEEINIPEISEEIMSIDPGTIYEQMYDENLKGNNVFSRYYDIFKVWENSENIKKEVCDTFLLSNFMHCVNRYFFPVFSGPQHNEYKELKLLNELVANEITKEMENNDE